MAYTSRVSKGRALTIPEMDNNFMCHYPIGSLYINALSNDSPHNLIGYGSWEQFAQGYVLVSADAPKVPGGIGTEGGFNDTPDKFLNIDHSTIGDTVQNSPDYYSPGFKGGLPSVNLNNVKFGSSLPSHEHYYTSVTNQFGTFSGRYRLRGASNKFRTNTNSQIGGSINQVPYINGAENYDWNPAGGNEQHNNIQPYITVNIWKRTK